MLRNGKQTAMSFHSELYELIPEDHLLKKVDQTVDFSFIQEIVQESYCVYYGRPANEPELLLRLLFLQTLYDLSDERMIAEAQVNLAYKWFLGLNPEDSLPDSSQLSRFRRHRLGAGNVEKVMEAIVKQCVEKRLIRSKAIIIDSTHTHMNASKQTPLEVLQKAAIRLVRSVKKSYSKLYASLPKKPKLENLTEEEQALSALSYLAELGEYIENRLPDAEGSMKEKLTIAKQIVEDERLLSKKGIKSAVDPDARFGWKSRSKNFMGYKNHFAMTEEEIITKITVTPGNEDDGKQLKGLLEGSKEFMEIEEILADTAYSSKDNLKLIHGQEMKASIPLNPVVYGLKEEDPFQYDKESDKVMCPAGHWSIRKAKTGKKNSQRNQRYKFYFDTSLCQKCPMKEGCYTGTKQKTYSISIKSKEHLDQMAYLETEEYHQRKKIRLRIEHKNAEMKRFHGLTTAKYRGLFGMQIQLGLTAFVVNVKRMIKLQEPAT
ncbi:IS1182 family transposase [Domibacillus aminovorans]|uniref:IS1182 family transposase n=1 Tax=Domibacillus aminovorans TaxID=29332 RepID=UPI000A4BDB46